MSEKKELDVIDLINEFEDEHGLSEIILLGSVRGVRRIIFNEDNEVIYG